MLIPCPMPCRRAYHMLYALPLIHSINTWAVCSYVLRSIHHLHQFSCCLNVCRISMSLASVTYFELLATLSLLCLALVCLINRHRLFASIPPRPKNYVYWPKLPPHPGRNSCRCLPGPKLPRNTPPSTTPPNSPAGAHGSPKTCPVTPELLYSDVVTVSFSRGVSPAPAMEQDDNSGNASASVSCPLVYLWVHCIKILAQSNKYSSCYSHPTQT
jgi:hypothetical protein